MVNLTTGKPFSPEAGMVANAGSANASVGGMMRNVGARIGVLGGGNMDMTEYINIVKLINNEAITDFNDGLITTIGNNSPFRNVNFISGTVTLRSLTNIKIAEAFRSLLSTEIHLPVLPRNYYNNTFFLCNRATLIDLPIATTIHFAGLLRMCTSLRRFNAPNLTVDYQDSLLYGDRIMIGVTNCVMNMPSFSATKILNVLKNGTAVEGLQTCDHSNSFITDSGTIAWNGTEWALT